MTSLRNRVIRLAHEKPELRPHLLPILAADAGSRVARTLTLKELQKTPQAQKATRAFKALQKATQKAQWRYETIWSYLEDAGTKPEYLDFPHEKAVQVIADAQAYSVEQAKKWVSDLLPYEKKLLEALHRAMREIDDLGVKLSSRGKSLRKDIDAELRQIEQNMRKTPRDWKEVNRFLQWERGIFAFRTASALYSRLIEEISGEEL